MSKENEKKIVLHYTGRYLSKKSKKLYHRYYDFETDHYHYYSKQLFPAGIGKAVEAIETETGVKGPFNPVDVNVRSSSIVSEWIAASQADTQLYNLYKKIKKVAENDLEPIVSRLHDLYLSLHPGQREAFLFQLCNRIRKGK
jgi:hypothetical protein